MSWRSLGLVALASFTLGCAIDTELGVEAIVESAELTLAADDTLDVSVALRARVGTHAEGERIFLATTLLVFASGELVAELVPSGGEAFAAAIAPGSEARGTLQASTASAIDPRRLCDGDAEVLVRWRDATTGELGSSTGEATVSCP